MREMAQGQTSDREQGCSGRVEWKGSCPGQGQQEQGQGQEPAWGVLGATCLEADPGCMNPTPADGNFSLGQEKPCMYNVFVL